MTQLPAIAELLRPHGEVSGPDENFGLAVHYTPNSDFDVEVQTHDQMRLVIEEGRDADVETVYFRAEVGQYHEDVDIVSFREFVSRSTARVRFGSVVVEGRDVKRTGIGTGRVYVRYAMPLTGGDCASVVEVVNEVTSLWETTTAHFRRAKRSLAMKRHAAAFHERRAAEIRRRLADPAHRLNTLVGLAPVKSMVQELAAVHEVNAKRRAMNLSPMPMSPNLVFTGNPGTGKTTVAEIVAKLYKQLGLVSKGHVVVAERADLVAHYIGQTAEKTRKVCESALGGVLFIDEAYSLSSRKHPADFGHEAIESLLIFMEKHRGDFAVIVAGYPDDMTTFIGSNPGLASRFDRTIDFPDYSETELMEILTSMINGAGWTIAEDAKHSVFNVIRSMPRSQGFGNAREMRRLMERLIMNQAVLVSRVDGTTKSDLSTITAAAVPVVQPSELCFIEEVLDF